MEGVSYFLHSYTFYKLFYFIHGLYSFIKFPASVVEKHKGTPSTYIFVFDTNNASVSGEIKMFKKIGQNLLTSFIFTMDVAIGNLIYRLDDFESVLKTYSIYLPITWFVIFLILTFQKQVSFL
jgi:hypothetical protein